MSEHANRTCADTETILDETIAEANRAESLLGRALSENARLTKERDELRLIVAWCAGEFQVWDTCPVCRAHPAREAAIFDKDGTWLSEGKKLHRDGCWIAKFHKDTDERIDALARLGGKA